MNARTLGLDVGRRRIGVALGDELGLTAQPLCVIENSGDESVHRAIASLVRRHKVGCIVIGLPLRTDGQPGPEVENIRQFGQRLEETVGVGVTYWDERFSTVEAEKMLIAAGVRRRRRREVIDQVAAGIVLQSYLDSRGGIGSV